MVHVKTRDSESQRKLNQRERLRDCDEKAYVLLHNAVAIFARQHPAFLDTLCKENVCEMQAKVVHGGSIMRTAIQSRTVRP